VFSPLIKNVFQIIVDIVYLVANVYVLSQSHGHWLLSKCLACNKYHDFETKNKVEMASSMVNLMEDDIAMVSKFYM
jgi:hypothetical protein